MGTELSQDIPYMNPNVYYRIQTICDTSDDFHVQTFEDDQSCRNGVYMTTSSSSSRVALLWEIQRSVVGIFQSLNKAEHSSLNRVPVVEIQRLRGECFKSMLVTECLTF